jgi:hypothetical protein
MKHIDSIQVLMDARKLVNSQASGSADGKAWTERWSDVGAQLDPEPLTSVL